MLGNCKKCDRRNFMRLGLGVLASCALPARAQRDCEIFFAESVTPEEAQTLPVMKKFKPEKIEICVGATKPFRMLHVSDTHLSFMNAVDLAKADEVEYPWYVNRRRLFEDAESGLAAALLYARVNKMPIIHTGDLIDYPSDGNLCAAQRDLEGCDCFFAAGNHELSGTPRPKPYGAACSSARAAVERYLPNPFAFHSRVVEGVDFVAFDNTASSNDIADEVFARIKGEFAKGLPVVLCYHVPFHSQELARSIMAQPGYKPANIAAIDEGWLAACPGKPANPINLKLREWLPRQKNLKAMLCGHLHYQIADNFTASVKQYVAGATFRFLASDILFT